MLALLLFALPLVAQSDTPAIKPVSVCIGQIRNQSAAKLDLIKERNSLLANLQTSTLGKGGSAEFKLIEAESSESAAEALKASGCEYAVYLRVLRKPKEQKPTGWDSGSTVVVSSTEKSEYETYGLQCTVESASTGMPILIDRQFDVQPAPAEKAVPKLLSAEAIRIAEALTKKLAK